MQNVPKNNTADLQAEQERAEQFRATFEQAAIGVAHISADFKWLRVNRVEPHNIGVSFGRS
jgi:hypothetical protein